MKLFNGLENAFISSTNNRNLFKDAIRRIKWDSAKYIDDEWVFRLGALIFTTPSLDPNECKQMWSPAVQMEDGKWIVLFA